MVERFLGKDVPLRFTKPKPKSFVSSAPLQPRHFNQMHCTDRLLVVQWQSFLGSR
jgi:hypothetical protein